MKLDEIRKMRAEAEARIDSAVSCLDQRLDLVAEEAGRLAEIAEHADEIIAEFDEQFESKTGLDRKDVSLLFVAIVLQVLRQIVISKICSYFDSIDTDRQLEDHNSLRIREEQRTSQDEFKNTRYKKGDEVRQGSGKYKDWLRILYDPVPYDITKGTKEELGGVGLGGPSHRCKTFGHDPWLGWIFGTVNIITDTISLSDFRTFKYNREPKPGTRRLEPIMFWDPFLGAMESIGEDKLRLPAAIAAQGVHIASDRYTKKMLPIPLSTILPESIAGKLYLSQWTEYTLACRVKGVMPVARPAVEAAFAMLINMIIGLVHGVLRDKEKFPEIDLYEVKTRKILMYSNAIATGTNLAQVAIRSFGGDLTAGNDVDLGGLVVTLYRIMSDTDFIRRAKDIYTFGKIEEKINSGSWNGNLF